KPGPALAPTSRPRSEEGSEPPLPPPPRPPRSGRGTISGRVSVRGDDGSPVYVYVADIQDPPARKITEQMKQQGKQFVPQVLVMPNSLYARAGADGSYRIANVPAGRHKIVAWTPFAVPTTMDADVSDGDTATVELSLTKGKRSPHLNKEGLPYGSYKE